MARRPRIKYKSDSFIKLRLEDIKRTLDTNLSPSQKIEKIVKICEECMT